MKYPELTIQNTSRDIIDVFGGYNHNIRIGDGEFYDMKNLTSSCYPVLSPRQNRGTYKLNERTNNEYENSNTSIKLEKNIPENPQGMIAKDSLCYVDGQYFVINGYMVDMGLSTEAKDNPKTLISMGAYVIIMPDKKYINTADITDFGNIEASVKIDSEISFTLCKIDGVDYNATADAANEKAPDNPQNLQLWIDTSSEPHTLKQYSSTNNMWVSIPTTYIKISATGIGIPFKEGDGVEISGIVDANLLDLNSTMVIQARDDDYIVVIGILDKNTTQSENPITVKRIMPEMDYIIESNNRLWGCRYGTDVNGNVVNEIYASKLGDFKNWNCFAGLSTDSYAATVGTDGQFTGAITHMGYPLFFKENYMHKVYGNYPANYQIQTTACRGVQKGCSKSLAIVNEVLYYKSNSSICAYDGSLPTEISAELGDISYSNAVSGALKNKYYISMMDDNEEYQLFVYDTKKGLWHREDNTHAVDFCFCRGELFYIDAKDKKIKTILGSGTTDTSKVKWMAETGIIGMSMPDKKYISRIDVRMSIQFGSRVMFFIDYDSIGSWEHIYTMDGIKTQSFTVPIRPRRCDHFRLRIEGEGDAKIYSICKTIEQGSEV